jgi:hypothetical protein
MYNMRDILASKDVEQIDPGTGFSDGFVGIDKAG